MNYPATTAISVHHAGSWHLAAELTAYSSNRIRVSYLDEYVFDGPGIPLSLRLPVAITSEPMRQGLIGLESEDLTSPIAKKQQWKRFNRKMSSWAKGSLAQALESVCTQRKAKHVLVNAAYTSQMDSTNGLLQGKRVGDKFYRASGDVIQADYNAALNVRSRLDDCEITRYMPYRQVRQILLARSPAQLSVKRLELGAQVRQPSADKS